MADTGTAGSQVESTSGATADSGIDGTTGNATTTSASTSSATSFTTSSPASTTTAGATDEPLLAFSDGVSYDFELRPITTLSHHEFTVTNIGRMSAQSVTVSVLDSGVGHDSFAIGRSNCGDVLDPGQMCAVEVAFMPTLFGLHGATLLAEYDTPTTSLFAALDMTGTGIGATDNLLVNGDGETGADGESPPPGWTAVSGIWQVTGSPLIAAYEGDQYIWPGIGIGGLSQYSVRQQIPVTNLTTWGDAEGIEFHVRSWLRSFEFGNDPAHYTMGFYDGGFSPLGEVVGPISTSEAWVELQSSEVAPAGTEVTQLSLECELQSGSACSAFFDGMEVWAEWNG